MAIRIDATTEEYTRTTNLPTSAFSLMGWFRLALDKNDYNQFLVIGDATGGGIYQIGTSSDGLTLEIYTGASSSNGSVLSHSTWYHIALTGTWNAISALIGYLNGVSNISTSGNFLGGTPAKLWIGNNDFDEFLNGRWAAVKIYDAILTAQEILRESYYYTPQRYTNLNSWFPGLDLNSDNVDFSGNGRNLTVGGSPTVEDGPPILWAPSLKKRFVFAPAVGGGGGPEVKTGSDDLSLNITDATSSILSTLTGSDSLSLNITDAVSAILSILSRVDDLSLNITEAQVSSSTLTGSDNLSLNITESALVAVILEALDDLSLNITDALDNIVTALIANDSLSLIITEAQQSLSNLSSTENLILLLTEVASGFGTFSSSDSLSLNITESTTLSLLLSALDNLSINITETSSAETADTLESYLRRYLNDLETVKSVGTPVTVPTGQETEFISYLRRHLNDKV